MRSYQRRDQDRFAHRYLNEHWPEDWDGKEWVAALADWEEEMEAALLDRFTTWKNERDAQRAIAAVGVEA